MQYDIHTDQNCYNIILSDVSLQSKCGSYSVHTPKVNRNG